MSFRNCVVLYCGLAGLLLAAPVQGGSVGLWSVYTSGNGVWLDAPEFVDTYWRNGAGFSIGVSRSMTSRVRLALEMSATFHSFDYDAFIDDYGQQPTPRALAKPGPGGSGGTQADIPGLVIGVIIDGGRLTDFRATLGFQWDVIAGGSDVVPYTRLSAGYARMNYADAFFGSTVVFDETTDHGLILAGGLGVRLVFSPTVFAFVEADYTMVMVSGDDNLSLVPVRLGIGLGL